MIEVYLLTNIETSRSYVGITSRATYGNGILITHAKRKHGKSAFYPTILARSEDKLEADRLERFYISLFNTLHPNGYNLALGGDGGAIQTEEMKEKLSKKILTMHAEHPEIREKVSKKLKGRVSPCKGRVLSQEDKDKISKSILALGFKHSEEHKEYMSSVMKNRSFSDETRKRMSDSAKVRASTPEGLARMKRASLIALENRK